MAGITLPDNAAKTDSIRPVNLQTDLAQLADLIEAAFSNKMDSNGRAAIREMRQLSRLGIGLGVLSNINDIAQGVSLGYVWTHNDRIIGNVSIYPATYPANMGRHWIVANVAVYPEFRGRGIARRLMHASLEMIRKRGGGTAILQVDIDNHVARRLYHEFGFADERAFTQWWRSAYRSMPQASYLADGPQRIVGRKLGDSDQELALARLVRPQEEGGLDWLRPTHPQTFRRSVTKRLSNWVNLRTVQRVVIRSEDTEQIMCWLQAENTFGVSSQQLTLMAHPQSPITYPDALLANAVRRFGGSGLAMNHPHDDQIISRMLHEYQFVPRRTVMHMRLKLD